MTASELTTFYPRQFGMHPTKRLIGILKRSASSCNQTAVFLISSFHNFIDPHSPLYKRSEQQGYFLTDFWQPEKNSINISSGCLQKNFSKKM
jgi:hypothetical protein